MTESQTTTLSLALVWTDPDVDQNMAHLRAVLREGAVSAVLATPVATAVGQRSDLTVAVHAGTIVTAPRFAGTAQHPLAVGEFLDLLRSRTGAHVVQDPADLHDHPELEHAAREARGRGVRHPLDPTVLAEAHQGEADPDRFLAVQSTGSVRLHQDLAVVSPQAAAAGASEDVVRDPSDPRASLTLSDRGGWCRLVWFSAVTMTTAQSPDLPRVPDLVLDVGRGVEVFPDRDLTEDDHALYVALAQTAGVPTLGQQAVLERGMSTVRAEQSLSSLIQCATDPAQAAPPLAQQPWLSQLRDAVEMLGFEPRLVDLVAGHAQTPSDAVEVGTGPADGDGPADGEPSQSLAQEAQPVGQAGGTGRAATPNWVYLTVVAQMLIGALFLFVKPLPWSWANLVVAAVAIGSGLLTLVRSELRR